MSEALQVKRPIYPLLGMILAVYVVVFALLSAKSDYCIFFLIGICCFFCTVTGRPALPFFLSRRFFH